MPMSSQRPDKLILVLLSLLVATCSANGQASIIANGGYYQQEVLEQGTEYITPTGGPTFGSAFMRRLQQVPEAPSLCGKLGTYIPNFYRAQGSMFGISISPNQDGSIIAVGAPMNTDNYTIPGGAVLLTSLNSKTCEYSKRPVVWQPKSSWMYFGAQIALSNDGDTLVVMDGVEAVAPQPHGTVNGTSSPSIAAGGNRPVVHIYRRSETQSLQYVQKLDCELRQAMAAAMSVSVSANGEVILVSFSVGESFPDKRGSAQVFYWDKSCDRYTFIQDLALLNQPAGVSVHYGAASQVSADGQIIAVATAAFANQLWKYTYMYKLDPATNRFRIVSSISNGEIYADPFPAASNMGVNIDNALSMTQSGKYLLRVENSMLVVYESSGSGMTINWLRRCQVAPPMGYIFRTSSSALTIVEVPGGKVKFAAGAYMGDLENSPEQMAVFLFYLNGAKQGSCPWRPAEKHTHPDPYSNYGAGVALTPNGKLLIVGAPTAWDNNMNNQSGAVFMIDVSSVEDDGLEAKTVTLAANTKAGCINGRDANGNFCVDKQFGTPLCKDITLKDGTVVHYGPPGCSPTPAPRGFWAASVPEESGLPPGVFKTSSVSAYSTLSPSIKGGVGVPVGQNQWLQNQVKAASEASYFGVPTTAVTNPKQSVVSAAGWPTSVSAALGGLPKPEAAPPGINARSVLSGLGALVSGLAAGGGGGGGGGAVPGRATGLGGVSGALPAGAVIRNPGVLSSGPSL